MVLLLQVVSYNHGALIHAIIISAYVNSKKQKDLNKCVCSEMRFLMVHDNARSPESIKNFFTDMYELFVKVNSFEVVGN